MNEVKMIRTLDVSVWNVDRGQFDMFLQSVKVPSLQLNRWYGYVEARSMGCYFAEQPSKSSARGRRLASPFSFRV